MKQIILALFALACSTGINAQCDKSVVINSSKTEYLNEKDEVKKLVDEKTVIDISKNSITISPESDHTMTGTILSATCDWKTSFKEGKTVLKASFEDQGKTKNVTLTIVGKEGKIYFLATFDDDPDKRIRVWADTFTEKH